jgi:hypothetical protein
LEEEDFNVLKIMAQKSNDLQFECSTAGTVCIIRFETLRSAESLHPLPLLAVHPISLTARSRKKPPTQHIIDDTRRFLPENEYPVNV